MPSSMTSFGRHRALAGGKDITVEIRSVNNRFYDCSLRLSRSFSHVEDRVRQYLKSAPVSRGKVDVYISVDKTASGSARIDIDTDLAADYIAALKKLRDTFSLRDDISVMKVAQRQDVFTVTKEEEDADGDFEALKTVIDGAFAEFFAGRISEGEKLAADILAKLELISEKVAEIERISASDIKNHKERFETRLRSVLSENALEVDENRLLTECALFADRISVDEETVRLRSHISGFREILAGTESVGRKLDFLSQELNREINTVGSKSQNAAISMLVVDVKCEIEKIREQVQNLE